MEDTSRKLRILCVDDHAFVAEGLRARLSIEPDLECVGTLTSAEGLLEAAVRSQADVAIIDIEMPGPDPFEAIRVLSRERPETRAVILSGHVRDSYIDAAVRAGAWGYLSKNDPPETIIEGLRSVARGEFASGAHANRRCRDGATGTDEPRPISKLNALTPREMQVLRLIAKGLSREAIARSLFRSPKTIDAHRMSIMGKLDIHDRVELARFAIREGLVEV